MPELTIRGSEVLGESVETIEPGSLVSLDPNHSRFFGLPDKSFFLTSTNPTARVPVDITAKNLNILRAAFAKKIILPGQTTVPVRPKLNLIQPIFDDFDKAKDLNEIRVLVATIVARRRFVPEVPTHDVLRQLLVREVDMACREEVVNYISRVMDQVDGPTRVVEHPQERGAVLLSQDKSTRKVSPVERPQESTEDRQARINRLIS